MPEYYCNDIFKRRDALHALPQSSFLRRLCGSFPSFARRIDEHWIGGWIVVVLRLAGATAAALSLFEQAKIPAAIILSVLGVTETLGVAAKRARSRDRFKAGLDRCQRFLDAVFTYLLGNHSDFRVTIQLTFKQQQTTFLRPILRNSGCSIEGARWLEFDDTMGRHEGVAGESWKTSSNLSRAAPRTNGHPDPRSVEYQQHMKVSKEFVEKGARNSNYLLAGVLLRNGKKVGVLTVDAKEAFNILGGDTRREDVESDKRRSAESARLQQMEGVVFSTIAYLTERVLPELFEETP